MRILGKCPNCGTEDSISTNENAQTAEEHSKATCSQCQKSWDDWLNLTFTERRNGNQLIPVLIEVLQWGAAVVWPQSRDIPCARLIISVLNTALMVRFKLQVCFTAVEGGIKGRVEGEPIELRNTYEQIGLDDDHHFEENPVCQKILNWYAGVLRALLEDELAVGDKNFGRGAILKLSPEDPLYKEKAENLLWLALYKKTGSQGFANAVFERLKIELAKPLSGPYVAGLTDEQITQFFVPPRW